MCQYFTNIDWLKLLQTGAAIFTAFIAFRALDTWKHQSKAQKQTHFLDELTDSIHEYIQSLASTREFFKFVKIGIECHKIPTNKPDENTLSNAHAIEYIKIRGDEDSKKLWEHLNRSNHIIAKINSLVARGQVYGFNNYESCSYSIKMLLWQHQRLQVVATVIGSTSWNWEHPQVQKSVKDMLSIEPADIGKHLEEYNLEYLNFLNENYKIIYS